MGGDDRTRAREIDLLRYQVDELVGAGIEDPDEDHALEIEEDRLADAVAHREAATRAIEALTGDGGGIDALGSARAALASRPPFAEVEARLHGLEAEASDIGIELRKVSEEIVEDPERLAQLRARRQRLRELIRKYGETLREVIAYRDEASARLGVLESHDARAAALDAERRAALDAVEKEARLGRRGPSRCGAPARDRGAVAPGRARLAARSSRDRRRR